MLHELYSSYKVYKKFCNIDFENDFGAEIKLNFLQLAYKVPCTSIAKNLRI